MMLINPILPGFYPDPSVCRKDDDYYLVTSTFEYFPGFPIFHSKDFVHWHQIGHVLDRPEQLELNGLNPSRGIYASSIFYHEGRFYMITTLVGNAPYWENVNFYVWAEDPAGPWSDPVIIQGAEGIDPSLVFDGDKVYYLGNCRPDPDHPTSARHIWMQELELTTGKLLGERYTLLTDGAMRGAPTPEGAHIYHIGDWYYLMIAEGGTAHYHSVTIFRSHQVTGPYEANPRNPLITHRNLRWDYPINSTGHADLIQLANGEWWAVLLASRPDGGDYRNLGRETFAVPVIWEDEWPVFSPDTGHVEFSYPAPKLPAFTPPSDEGLEWITVRTPHKKYYEEIDDGLRLFMMPEAITGLQHCAFRGRRQQHMCYCFEADMQCDLQGAEEAGIVLLMNHKFHLRFVLRQGRLQVIRCYNGEETVLGEKKVDKAMIHIKVETQYQNINFYADGQLVAGTVDGRLLSKEIAGGFTGTILGMYASSKGQQSENYVDFYKILYQGLKE